MIYESEIISYWANLEHKDRPLRVDTHELAGALGLLEDTIDPNFKVDITHRILKYVTQSMDALGFKRTLFEDGWFYVPPAKFAFLKPRAVPGTKKEIAKDLKDAEKVSRQTFVYFLQPVTGGAIKIGKTDDIKKRLDQLQTASAHRLLVLLLIPETEATERELHAAFADHRIREDGEWFHPHDDIVKFIHDRHFVQLGIE